MGHKAGFVNIIGSPNVGKSTLMNALVGEQLSVVTAKAQTTRHRILGFVNGEDYQIVFSDTPGILEPKYLLQVAMMHAVVSAMEDADVFLLMTEMGENFKHPEIIEKIKNANVPVLLLINKIDTSNQEAVQEQVNAWQMLLPDATIIPLSALHGFNVDMLINTIIENLPEAPPYYDKDDLTDRPERFFISEMIRGQILEQFKKEVPYSTEVVVESFKDEPEILKISAVIYVIRESQKAILIGDGGQAIKRLGMNSRRQLEKFYNRHIFLELNVKVSKDWREDKIRLKRFGYPL